MLTQIPDEERSARERELLEAGRRGDEATFTTLVAPYRTELHAHCYRMLGSIHDADDALQNSLLGAWRGLDRFEGRSSLRSWLYRITTHACLRLLEQRPKRLLSVDYVSAIAPDAEIGQPLTDRAWLEPYPDDNFDLATPEARYELRESVELAFVAALQHLPARQRAVLILREVLGYRAADVAELLDTSIVSVNSALQRARKTLDGRVPERSQQATLKSLGEDGERHLVEAFVSAWENADVATLVSMLAKDARFTMPPLPAWLDGPDDISGFMSRRLFATPWRLQPVRASGQLAFVCHQGNEAGTEFVRGALNVLTLDADGQISELTGFVDPAISRRFVRVDGVDEGWGIAP